MVNNYILAEYFYHLIKNTLQIGALVIKCKHTARGEARLLKIRIEICDDGEDEIIIRCRTRDEKINRIESALEGIVKSRRELTLYIGNTEYYVPVSDILFFETDGGRVCAHTRDRMFTAQYKLFELENLLPSSFVRISKSAIANVMRISSLSRELVGNGEIAFANSDKRTYFSRAYYKVLRDRIDEIRLK